MAWNSLPAYILTISCIYYMVSNLKSSLTISFYFALLSRALSVVLFILSFHFFSSIFLTIEKTPWNRELNDMKRSNIWKARFGEHRLQTIYYVLVRHTRTLYKSMVDCWNCPIILSFWNVYYIPLLTPLCGWLIFDYSFILCALFNEKKGTRKNTFNWSDSS